MNEKRITPTGAGILKGKVPGSPQDPAGGAPMGAEIRVSTDGAVPRKPDKEDGDRIYVEHWGINE